jgi:predicted peroxiredoxin
VARLLYFGSKGSADPTSAAMPFIMANGAAEAGHEPAIVLVNEAVDLMNANLREHLVPFGWPPFTEILARTVEHGVPIYI